MVPVANQDAAIAPVNPKVAMQLARFHLCLVHHPWLLVCTHTNCTYNLPLVLFTKEVLAHLKQFHQHTLVDSSKKMLAALLEEQDLQHPYTVRICKDLLPAPMIPELEVAMYQGYACNTCSYAVQSKSAIHAHLHKHKQEGCAASLISGVVLQQIDPSQRRYLYVVDKQLDPLPPQPFPAVAADPIVDDAVQAKANGFVKQDQEAMCCANLLKPGIAPAMLTGNLGPWAKQLGWQAYWASKNIVGIGQAMAEPDRFVCVRPRGKPPIQPECAHGQEACRYLGQRDCAAGAYGPGWSNTGLHQ